MALLGSGIWHHLIRTKYIKDLTFEEWMRNKDFTVRGTSFFWNGFLRTLTWITRMLSWEVGDGLSIKLGINPIIGMDSHFILSDDLRDYLNHYGLTTLHHIQNLGDGLSTTLYWLSTEDLDLGGRWKMEWDCYIKGLT